jgi:hypothetical protein
LPLCVPEFQMKSFSGLSFYYCFRLVRVRFLIFYMGNRLENTRDKSRRLKCDTNDWEELIWSFR